MMNDNETFKVLYSFTSDSLFLAEVKKTDSQPGDDLDKVYYWFSYEPKAKELEKLHFQSMDSEGQTQLRDFEQASLRFTDDTATYLANTDTAITDLKDNNRELSGSFRDSIRAFLGS